MEQRKLNELKKGEFFTLKPIEEPNDNHVWVRDHYDRKDKSFSCHRFGDYNEERFFKADAVVFVGFTF